ncbi:Aspartic peptidase [Gossypium australe]|uniref:Aspartic peptidase n=1 Tax=Gossypium australe TaxID=47621 RepID=A0A5B6W5Y1_9ROSI|nr:Aspartic peptidase [Gossypium australe]
MEESSKFLFGWSRKSKVITPSMFSATLSTRKEVESGRDNKAKLLRKDGVEECKKEYKLVVREYKPLIPYLTKLKKDRMNEQYGKFLELLKKFHIKLPFVEALLQMPKYTKFLKELLTNKRKLDELSTVELNDECSSILQNKYPRGIIGDVVVKVNKFVLPFEFVILDMDEDIEVPMIIG